MIREKEMEHASFFGLRISIFSYEQLVDYIDVSLELEKCRVFYGYSMGLIAKLKEHKEIYYSANRFDLMVSDGRLLFFLAKYAGLPVRYDISVPYLTELVLRIGAQRKASVMIIGSTREKNKAATNRLKWLYNGLTVFDGYDGGAFNSDEYARIVDHVNSFKPDILLVGVSSPKKENFAAKNKGKLNVKILIPCGGMVDILAGHTKMIPKLIKKTGFGWLWRLLCEPKRLLLLHSSLLLEIVFRIVPAIMIRKKTQSDFFLPSIYGVEKPER